MPKAMERNLFEIVEKKLLAPAIYMFRVYSPWVAENSNPGQFIILKTDEKGERIPLTIADYDSENGLVTVVIQAIGHSTEDACSYNVGEKFNDFVGPLGQASDLINQTDEELKGKKILFVTGGLGAAPVYPQVKYLHSRGIDADVIMGAKTKEMIIYEEDMKKVANNVFVVTDDESYGNKGFVTDEMVRLIENEGKKYDEVIAIGRLERFVADYAREKGIKMALHNVEKKNKKVAVIGSGPSGIACAGDLAKLGYDVTIFEALHEAGGVLVYGIPEFRLPKKEVVEPEIQAIKDLGVKIETNVIIGKTLSVDELVEKQGYEVVYIASGAGLPNFMHIKGEGSNGVFSANELLTRNNLMKAHSDEYKTPVTVGKKAVIVGAGNVAMDVARTAIRLGAEVTVVYRRTEAEAPARLEEIEHAKEEGVKFSFLTNPVEIIPDEHGWVKKIRCIRMELGEPDEKGRRRPVEIPDSEFEIESDTVIISIGTSPNPLISQAIPGLELNRWKGIVTDEETGATNKEGIYAGGDAVTGATTVILAMGAGKKAAKAIDEMLNGK